jgi:23S rRNA pseudouridine1911/1915/1917 synthase
LVAGAGKCFPGSIFSQGKVLVNKGWCYREQVSIKTVGQTVLEYYAQHYLHSSREQWLQRINLGQVLINDQVAIATTLFQPGDWLTYNRPPWQEPEVPLDFQVIYEDQDILVVNKPSGLPVVPGGGFLEHTLLWQLQQRYPETTPIPIHRLGRGTSGLVLLARSPAARAGLSQQMRDRQIEKIYRALASDHSMPDQFTVTARIGKLPHPVLGYLYAVSENGRFAHSDCRVLSRQLSTGAEPTALVEVKISTGRPHQIRIHLAAAGHPLWGDPLYGVGGLPRTVLPTETGELPTPGDCGYFLHAMQLKFAHPMTNKALNITSPPPPELIE